MLLHWETRAFAEDMKPAKRRAADQVDVSGMFGTDPVSMLAEWLGTIG
jgi:hypothetical protein